MLERLYRPLCCCCGRDGRPPQADGYTPMPAPPAAAPDVVERPTRASAGEAAAPAAAPSAPAAPSSSSAARCQVTVHSLKPWQDAKSGWHADLQLDVRNIGATPLAQGWSLAVDLDQASAVAKPWNWSAALTSPGHIEGTAPSSWQAMAPGESANVGAIVDITSRAAQVTGARLNGERCLLLRS